MLSDEASHSKTAFKQRGSAVVRAPAIPQTWGYRAEYPETLFTLSPRAASKLSVEMVFSETARRRSSARALGRGAVCCLVLWQASQTVAATHPTATHRRTVELSPWERAVQARDSFEATPESARTSAEYNRVMDGFRAIYHDNPRDLHAPEAVNAVAELLAEHGRGRHDPRSARVLEGAIGQYEFLRSQYPGSSLRVAALLSEAQIEANDLGHPDAAREKYSAFLKQYPRNSLAEEARAGLAALDTPSRPATPVTTQHPAAIVRQSPHPELAVASARPTTSLPPSTLHPIAPTSTKSAPDRSTNPAFPEARTASPRETLPASEPLNGSALSMPVPEPKPHRSGPLSLVTGIRHWSTPSYTRVAIDLGDEVQYEAARVPSPDRIYFDLHGTRLARDLVGKSFAVTDDGFLKKIRTAQFSNDMTRVVLDVNDVTEYSAFLLPNPYRLIIDIHGGTKPSSPAAATIDSPARPAAAVPNTRAINAGSSADVARLSDQPGKVEATSVPTSQPIAAVVPGRSRAATAQQQPSSTTGNTTLNPTQTPALPEGQVTATTPSPLPFGSLPTRRSRKSRTTPADARVVGDPGTPARAAVPTADGETSLVRALGLKIGRIVIDAGHGGHDSGTIGVDGIEEKEVVLDVALRLGRFLTQRLGAEVIYTRSDDTFVPLETRTAIANKAEADLFLSVHANSSPEPSARGVETYYLNFTSQPDALETAARENAVSGQSIHQLSDLVKKITLKDKIAESREFASDVETSLYSGLQRGNEGLKNRGVKKAPFIVLIGANMPSILAEISFVTNPRDASQMRQPEYRERIAQSLYRGVAYYAEGLSGAPSAAQRTASDANAPCAPHCDQPQRSVQ